MTLWFSASAAVPNLLARGEISEDQASLLTGAVQLGFVVGTLGSAMLGLADLLESRRFFAVAAAGAACVNALLLYSSPETLGTVLIRGVTGMFLTGVYPVGMKLAVDWSTAKNRGLMVGALVGALTLGSALPHLFNAFRAVDWQMTIAASSVCALAGSLAINLVTPKPSQRKRVIFAFAEIGRLFQDRAIKLVTIGYLGHMWELYAMWAWIGNFLMWLFTVAVICLPRFSLRSLRSLSSRSVLSVAWRQVQ
jgi:predicted MFS family arabinose efflux permease